VLVGATVVVSLPAVVVAAGVVVVVAAGVVVPFASFASLRMGYGTMPQVKARIPSHYMGPMHQEHREHLL